MKTITIFISYRREDSFGHTGHIYDRLVERFGQDYVFRDVDTITPGEDFVVSIQKKLSQSQIVLAIIGPRWLSAADAEGRWRLTDENDLVRIEIATALDRNIRIIPVLVQKAQLPNAKDLPGDLVKLVEKNALEIRDTNFENDVNQLIEKIGTSWENKLRRAVDRWQIYTSMLILLVCALFFAFYPQFALTPEKARAQLAQMGVNYDADTFVDRANVKNFGATEMKIMDLFLLAGMAPDVENKGKISALKRAAANGNFELVKKLVNSGADISKAMPWAAGHGQSPILDFMLQRNPGQLAINQSLHSVAGTDHTEIIKLLLDKGADVNFVDGSTVLIEAVSSRSPNVEQVKLLLSKGADINLKGIDSEPSALFVAASKFNSELVDLLIFHGADVNVKNNENSTPLHEAIHSRVDLFLYTEISKDTHEITIDDADVKEQRLKQQRLNIVKSLVDKGTNLEIAMHLDGVGDRTALLHAIDNEENDIALFLIDRGANINAQISNDNSRGDSTPLMSAISRQMIDVVDALIAKGANINISSEMGNTALLEAAISSNGSQIVPKLLAHGANVKAVNQEGRTVLMNVARSDFYIGDHILKLLLHSGAKLDATDRNGWTALMHAANSHSWYKNNSEFEVAKQLVNYGADIKPVSDEGESALDIATKAGNLNIANLLKNHIEKRPKKTRESGEKDQ